MIQEVTESAQQIPAAVNNLPGYLVIYCTLFWRGGSITTTKRLCHSVTQTVKVLGWNKYQQSQPLAAKKKQPSTNCQREFCARNWANAQMVSRTQRNPSSRGCQCIAMFCFALVCTKRGNWRETEATGNKPTIVTTWGVIETWERPLFST